MSYSIIPIPKFDYRHILNPSEVMNVSMGALSAADATTLQVSIKVGAFAGVTASLALQESYDGVVWTAVTSLGAAAINAVATFVIRVAGAHGPTTPLVRLVITADAATTIGITSITRTFVQSSVMIPRDIAISGVATEVTLAAIKLDTAAIATNTANTKTAVDLTTTAVNTVKTAADLTTTAVNTVNTTTGTVKTAVDLTTTAVNTVKTAADLTTTAVNAVKTAADLTTTAVNAVKTAADLTTTAVDLTTTAVNTVKTTVESTNTKLDTLLTRVAGSLVNVAHNQIVPNLAGATTDIYVYKLATVTVKTLTISYADSSKQVISDVTAV